MPKAGLRMKASSGAGCRALFLHRLSTIRILIEPKKTLKKGLTSLESMTIIIVETT
jgi:hypothetical protein